MKNRNPQALSNSTVEWHDVMLTPNNATRSVEGPSKIGFSEHLAQMDSLLKLLVSSQGTTADIARLQALARAGQTDSEMEV